MAGNVFQVNKYGFVGRKCALCDATATIIYADKPETGELVFEYRCWNHQKKKGEL
jgi:hypothetical protein